MDSLHHRSSDVPCLAQDDRKFRIPTKEEWKRLFYIGFFSTFLYQAFFMYGMRYTAAGDASPDDHLQSHHTALLAIPFLGEKMTKDSEQDSSSHSLV